MVKKFIIDTIVKRDTLVKKKNTSAAHLVQLKLNRLRMRLVELEAKAENTDQMELDL